MPEYYGWSKVIAKAWTDDGYKKRLIENPREELMAAGIHVPGNTDVSIEEGETQHRLVLGLPPKPTGIDEDNLAENVLQNQFYAFLCK